jgi:hypothetical protein
MIWVCRKSIIEELVSEFKLQSYLIFNIEEGSPETLSQIISKELN